MKNINKYKNWLPLLIYLFTAVFIYVLADKYYYRIDLTRESRYSLSDNTKSFINKLNNNYEVELYLSGELPYGFKKLQQATIDIINEINRSSNKKISYSLLEPEINNNETLQRLAERGLNYTSVNIKDKEGKLTQQLLFPSLILHDRNKEIAINLLQNNPTYTGQENLNQSIANLEYEIINGLRMIERERIPTVAFLKGHNELSEVETLDFTTTLSENYNVIRTTAQSISNDISAIIIAQPREIFTEEDKYSIDQYIMKGGKVMWLIDEVEVSKDSLRANQYATAFYKPLNIEDQLFSYGIRINPKLVLDRNADLVKINTAFKHEPPRFTPLAWAYEPLLETNPYHSITKGLSPVRATFANTIDTLPSQKTEATVLLRTSTATRLESVPKLIEVNEINKMQNANFYQDSNIPVGVLLEGNFTSVFQGRLAFTKNSEFKKFSINNKMIVIADGDIIKNETRGSGESMQFLPLGYNLDYKYIHGNKTFLLNAIDFLCDDEGWSELRNKEYTPALLNKSRARSERIYWQLVNVLFPLIGIILIGLFYTLYRKKKYAK